jgi:hypothetical protein
MSSKRAIRRKACNGKIQYSSYEDALIVKKRMNSQGETSLRVYVCNFCKQYHIGHYSKKEVEYSKYGGR